MIKYYIHILLNLVYVLFLEHQELAHQRYIENHKYYVRQSKFNLFQFHQMNKDKKK